MPAQIPQQRDPSRSHRTTFTPSEILQAAQLFGPEHAGDVANGIAGVNRAIRARRGIPAGEATPASRGALQPLVNALCLSDIVVSVSGRPGYSVRLPAAGAGSDEDRAGAGVIAELLANRAVIRGLDETLAGRGILVMNGFSGRTLIPAAASSRIADLVFNQGTSPVFDPEATLAMQFNNFDQTHDF